MGGFGAMTIKSLDTLKLSVLLWPNYFDHLFQINRKTRYSLQFIAASNFQTNNHNLLFIAIVDNCFSVPKAFARQYVGRYEATDVLHFLRWNSNCRYSS